MPVRSLRQKRPPQVMLNATLLLVMLPPLICLAPSSRGSSSCRGRAGALRDSAYLDGVKEVLVEALPFNPGHQVGCWQHEQCLQGTSAR